MRIKMCHYDGPLRGSGGSSMIVQTLHPFEECTRVLLSSPTSDLRYRLGETRREPSTPGSERGIPKADSGRHVGDTFPVAIPLKGK